jgi:hypothetical protein
LTERTWRLAVGMYVGLAAMGCICCGQGGPGEGNTRAKHLKVSPVHTLARGSWMTVQVDAGTAPAEPLELKRAQSVDEAIARASVLDARDARIDGVAVGYTDIKLEGSHPRFDLSDRMTVHVEEARAMALHTCAAFGPSIYLAGHDNAVRFAFNPGPGTRTKDAIRGRGYYPVAIEPAGAGEVVPELGGDDYLVVRLAPDAPEEVVVRSTLKGDHRSVTLRVLKPEQVRIGLLDVDEPGTLVEGERGELHVHYSTFDPEHERTPICAMLPYTVETSEECRFSAQSALQDAGKSIYGAGVGLVVEAVRAGMCKVTVRSGITGVMVMGSLSMILVEEYKAPTPPRGERTHRRHHFDFD